MSSNSMNGSSMNGSSMNGSSMNGIALHNSAPNGGPMNSWKRVAAAEQKQPLGVTRDMLQRLAEINPEMVGELNLDEALSSIKTALVTKPAPAPVAAPKKHSVLQDARAQRLAELNRQLNSKRAEMKKIEDEIAQLSGRKSP